MPLWAEDHFVIGAHQLAPLAALATNVPLPPKNNAVVLPRNTTGLTAAAQSSQNTGLVDGSSTYGDAATTCSVVTVGGQAVMSRQLIDQGTPDVDQIIARDLGAAIGASKEAQIVSGSGSSGQLLGLINQVGVQTIATTGSVAGIYSAVAAAVSFIYESFALAGFYGRLTGVVCVPSVFHRHRRPSADATATFQHLFWCRTRKHSR